MLILIGWRGRCISELSVSGLSPPPEVVQDVLKPGRLAYTSITPMSEGLQARPRYVSDSAVRVGSDLGVLTH